MFKNKSMAYTYPNKPNSEKNKINEYISDYAENKVLYDLIKKHSPYHVKIIEDISDNWFIQILFYKRGTGVIVDKHSIIRPDLKTWISYLESLGYKIVN